MRKKTANHILLGVNVDHVATLRQLRGATTAYPNLFHHVKACIAGGAEQITIHLREDRRHIQLADFVLLAKKCPVPLNFEMAPQQEMFNLAIKHLPSWICLVPEKREELTTEGGLNLLKNFTFVQEKIKKVQQKGIEVSCFIEPDLKQVEAAAALKADAVEFHTGHWVLAKGTAKEKIWKKLILAARLANELGLRVHAGHGLDFEHAKKIRSLPFLVEVNIGHSLICYALDGGLKKSVQMMKKCLKSK